VVVWAGDGAPQKLYRQPVLFSVLFLVALKVSPPPLRKVGNKKSAVNPLQMQVMSDCASVDGSKVCSGKIVRHHIHPIPEPDYTNGGWPAYTYFQKLSSFFFVKFFSTPVDFPRLGLLFWYLFSVFRLTF
jgi:hypothetical protein